ncbi:MAG TPA: low molecular weight protein arginine phosphatase, partial [Bacillota bacterium]|nr:low molecular weight protein arginine phosphatase [Bacillota bacterium]
KEYVTANNDHVWDELKKANADLEEKKSQFMQKYQRKLDNNVLLDKLQDYVQEDIDKIRKLEAELISYDISDPFGGDFSTYQKTLDELETYIDLLLEKVDQNH